MAALRRPLLADLLQVDRRTRRAFTLLETLVALIIFGVISMSLSAALIAALEAQASSNRHSERNGEVAGVYDLFARDLQAAYAPQTSASGIFLAGQSAGSGQSSGLLTLSTLSHRVEAGTPAEQQTASQPATTGPQSDFEWVRYDFDPRAKTLSRVKLEVPNVQTLSAQKPQPQNVIASGVTSIQIRFWDGSQWKENWDLEGQAPQPPSGATASGSGAQAPAGGSAAPAQPASQAGTDSTLPLFAELTLTLENPNAPPSPYRTTIPLAAGVAAPTGNGQSGAVGSSAGGSQAAR